MLYCLGLHLPATNEQPGCHLNLNDSTDAALLIAHLLTWSVNSVKEARMIGTSCALENSPGFTCHGSSTCPLPCTAPFGSHGSPCCGEQPGK